MKGEKVILALGGAAIKTAWEEVKEVVQEGKVDMLLHNGASLFHDCQRATERIEGHSYPLETILKNVEILRPASMLVWEWVEKSIAPSGSVTRLCSNNGISVLLFSAPGCDFWQTFGSFYQWETLGSIARYGFNRLVDRMKKPPFRFLSLGSAVTFPEVFTKALAVARPKRKSFRADVVDFLEMYRPRTRIAPYGSYYNMEIKEFLQKWMRGEIR